MDNLILEKKIDSILRCVDRIRQRLPASEAEFLKDFDAQDVVILNLTRAVQVSVDIATHLLASTGNPVPETMSAAFSGLEKLDIISSSIALKMRKSVGFRNIAVHNYDDVDLSITYTIASQHLKDFTDFIEQILSLQSK